MRERSGCRDCFCGHDSGTCPACIQCRLREEPVLDGEPGQFPGAEKDTGEHRTRESPRVGVAERWVVGGKQMNAIWKNIFGTVSKAVGGFAGDNSGL